MVKGREVKKAVVFIVEGNSDKRALEKIFQTIYKHKNIVFKFMGEDITSNEEMNKSNVCEAIYKKVDKYMRDNKLKKRDIWQIVHIFDTDGTYVPESAVASGRSSKFVYSETQISCKSRNKILERNERKSEMMNFLLKQNEINGISYIGYFMSSNLDHALYNEQNLDDELKGKYADAFYAEFQGRELLFVDFLKDEIVNGVPDLYPQSWRYIKEGLRSLERHTNLHVYFETNPYG